MSIDLGGVTSAASTYAKDLAERVVSTFLQAFLGGIVITQPLDGSMWYAAAGAGVAAAAALVKGVLAKLRGEADSASLAKGV
jgi:ribose 5-phosphate isomerase RpiB